MDHGIKDGDNRDTCQPDDTGRFFMNTIAISSRWLFLLTVLGSALISVALFIYGFVLAIVIIVKSFSTIDFNLESMKTMMAASIEIIDLFLVATVFISWHWDSMSSSSQRRHCPAG